MPVRFESFLYPLGYDFNVQKFRYGYGQHALIHSVSNPRDRNGRYRWGSGFLKTSREILLSPATLPQYTYNGNLHGGLAADVQASGAPYSSPTLTSWSTVQSNLTPYGATGFARARPGNPVANMGQFLYELRDTPKMIPSFLRGSLKGMPRRALRTLASFRQMGNHYLNYQFGWKPFVNDLREMYKLSYEIDDRLDKLRRNNGRGLHRERVLKDSTERSESSLSLNYPFAYLYPTPILGLSSGSSKRVSETIYQEKIWFEGKFRYWVPNIGSPQWTTKARRALFGATVTPSLLWEIMPWSWLIDWFSNAGDVFSNISSNALESVVAQYAFVMRTYSSKTTHTVTTNWSGRTSGPIQYMEGSAVSLLTESFELKSRVIGNPYGFGITYDGLSGYQQSILAALAITRKSMI